MTHLPCKAQVRGLPHNPNVTEINVRFGPGTNYAILFKAAVGLRDLAVLDVERDSERKEFSGKIYQWFKLKFSDGRVGWIRDDLLAIYGDCSEFGFFAPEGDSFEDPSYAFLLSREELDVARAIATPVIPDDDPDRVRKAAFSITARFEGRGYSSYQDYDRGIISYGRFQFTLASASLEKVLKSYLSASTSAVAGELRQYLRRVEDKDRSLRDTARFRELLELAAEEPDMQQAQDRVATDDYWNVVQNLSIKPRGIKTPLAQALVFDMGINFGTRHGFFTKAEEELGVPARSVVGENGITEEELVTRIAALRKESHDRQAVRDNLPGLKVRGDFWVDLVRQGDWQLQGDDDGSVLVKPGARVQVRNP